MYLGASYIMTLASQSVRHAPDSRTWVTEGGSSARHHMEDEAPKGQIHQMDLRSLQTPLHQAFMPVGSDLVHLSSAYYCAFAARGRY